MGGWNILLQHGIQRAADCKEDECCEVVAQEAFIIPVGNGGIYFVRIGNGAVRKIAVTMH